MSGIADVSFTPRWRKGTDPIKCVTFQIQIVKILLKLLSLSMYKS